MDEGIPGSPDRRERMDGKGGLRMGSLIKKLALPRNRFTLVGSLLY